MSRRAKRQERQLERFIDRLVEDAANAKRELAVLNIRIEELTPALEFIEACCQAIATEPDHDRDLRTVGIIYDLVAAEMDNTCKRRDWHAWQIESYRQRDIPQVTKALDDLVIGGITFG